MILQPVRSLEDCQHNFDQIQQQQIFAGTGVPTFVAKAGSLFLRKDDLTTANHRIYINTADGVNWTGIL